MMAIESSAFYEPPTQTESNTIEAWLAQRHFNGQGFNDLSQALAFRLSAITNSIQAQRPLFFVAKYTDEKTPLISALNPLVADAAESLAIPLNPDLTTYLELADFSDQVTQYIIDDTRRPLIQPLGIGSGEYPSWWLGPLWIFPSHGPVDAFRRQFEDLH